jgi:hypothetical protein
MPSYLYYIPLQYVPGLQTKERHTMLLTLVCILIFRPFRKTKLNIMAVLLPHAVVGCIELILFYGGFGCSLLALIACLIHSATSLALAKHLHRGYEPITRTYPSRLFLSSSTDSTRAHVPSR